MDRRETAFDPFDGTFDQGTMIGFVGGDDTLPVHCHWDLCDVCDGKGTHVNPAVDSHGISAEEFAADPEFEESYRAGVYDVPCAQCHGRRTVPVPNDNDPNLRAFIEYVQGHYDYLAEREAEMRMGA